MTTVCVIGCGMIGSSAAANLCAKGFNVILIGPEEPCESERATTKAFAMHHDEGRITRKTDPDSLWGLLAQQSIKRYREIEEASHVTFYHEVGHLVVGPASGEHLQNVQRNAATSGIEVETLNGRQMQERFPWLQVPLPVEETQGVFEQHDAGWISPRNFVAAQVEIAKQHGCRRLVQTAVSVTVRQDGMKHVVLADDGHAYEVDGVVVANGASAGMWPEILDSEGEIQRQLDMTLKTTQVALLEVSEKTLGDLSAMPSLIFKDPDSWMCYVLPPIRYPDGKIWMKIGGEFCTPEPPAEFEGCAVIVKKEIRTFEDAAAWYQSRGSPAEHESLVRMFQLLFPSITVLSSRMDCCVIPYTPSRRPYVEAIRPGLVVACGCNGFAAKSADALGRLAASFVFDEPATSEFPSAADLNVFRGSVQFKA